MRRRRHRLGLPGADLGDLEAAFVRLLVAQIALVLVERKSPPGPNALLYSHRSNGHWKIVTFALSVLPTAQHLVQKGLLHRVELELSRQLRGCRCLLRTNNRRCRTTSQQSEQKASQEFAHAQLLASG